MCSAASKRIHLETRGVAPSHLSSVTIEPPFGSVSELTVTDVGALQVRLVSALLRAPVMFPVSTGSDRQQVGFLQRASGAGRHLMDWHEELMMS